jgi:hypothetical protein
VAGIRFSPPTGAAFSPRHRDASREGERGLGNISHGPQQVNNGGIGISRPSAHAHARAENSEPEQSKLLEHETDGEWMDTGTAGEAGGSDKEMAAVGAVHRPKDFCG